MSERTISQSMPRRLVISVAPGASVADAARVMTRARCGSVLVLDTLGHMLGIVTERDLMTRVLARDLNPATTTVTDIMTRNPVCASPDMRVSDAVLTMMERGFRHLPVLTAAGKILGVFSVRDALPREVGAAVSMAEFHQQVNDALG